MDTVFSSIFEYYDLLLLLHIAGAVVSLGAVAATDLLLVWLKLKPHRVAYVALVSPLLSLQVWIGLLVLSVTGLFLFVPYPELAYYPPFQLKILLVLALFVNGVFLNTWVAPRFERLVPEWEKNTPAVRRFTVIASISALISFVAWWGAFIIMYTIY